MRFFNICVCYFLKKIKTILSIAACRPQCLCNRQRRCLPTSAVRTTVKVLPVSLIRRAGLIQKSRSFSCNVIFQLSHFTMQPRLRKMRGDARRDVCPCYRYQLTVYTHGDTVDGWTSVLMILCRQINQLNF